jgi:hypothetical protein
VQWKRTHASDVMSLGCRPLQGTRIKPPDAEGFVREAPPGLDRRRSAGAEAMTVATGRSLFSVLKKEGEPWIRLRNRRVAASQQFRHSAERAYPKLVHYNKIDKGGCLATSEQPQLSSEEIRAGLRSLRK